MPSVPATAGKSQHDAEEAARRRTGRAAEAGAIDAIAANGRCGRELRPAELAVGDGDGDGDHGGADLIWIGSGLGLQYTDEE